MCTCTLHVKVKCTCFFLKYLPYRHEEKPKKKWQPPKPIEPAVTTSGICLSSVLHVTESSFGSVCAVSLLIECVLSLLVATTLHACWFAASVVDQAPSKPPRTYEHEDVSSTR